MSDPSKISAWLTLLRSIAVANILLWSLICLPLAGGSSMLKWQVALSGIYVAVCAFRSWLPRIDLERYCIVDTHLSNMFIGRCAATVAEVCFAGQLALFIGHMGDVAQLNWLVSFAYFVVPPLALAQCFCWYSVVTLNHLGHAIEESLWAFTMAAVGVCMVLALPHLPAELLPVAIAGIAAAFCFVTFMVVVDIPMYLRRWREGRRAQARYLSARDGLRDAIERRIATHDWEIWRPEVAWLTGYFSFAVWLSVSMVQVSAS